MTLPADPVAAVLTYLRTDPDLLALVGDRIYGAGRPESGPSSLPAPALTMTPVGRAAHRDLPLADVEMEIRCWGGLGVDGAVRAVAIWRAIHRALNVSDRVAANARLLWAVEVSGPALLRDPDTQEPFVRCGVRAATADD